VQKINFTEFVPSGDADDVNLKYRFWSDQSYIGCPKMLGIPVLNFLLEFPEGIDVTVTIKGRRHM
jgi:hypothetical protein